MTASNYPDPGGTFKVENWGPPKAMAKKIFPAIDHNNRAVKRTPVTNSMFMLMAIHTNDSNLRSMLTF